MRRAARATAFTVLVVLVAQMFRTSDAQAEEQSPAAGPGTLEIPPSPALAAPRLAIEVHTGLTMPLDNDAVCPPRAGCVLESGGGIGVSFERRYPSGFGALVAYDAWFVDSDSVYELAVQQLLRGGVRYTMPTEYVFHPIFEGSVGMMGLGLRAFTHSAFRTERDGVQRGKGLFSESAFIEVGLTVM